MSLVAQRRACPFDHSPEQDLHLGDVLWLMDPVPGEAGVLAGPAEQADLQFIGLGPANDLVGPFEHVVDVRERTEIGCGVGHRSAPLSTTTPTLVPQVRVLMPPRSQITNQRRAPRHG